MGSQADYARHAKVSRQAVGVAVREGRIDADDKGRIPDFAIADAQWAENTDPTKPANRITGNPKGSAPKRQGSATRGIAESHARKAKAQASREELKLQQELRELLRKVEVDKAVFDVHRRARDRVRMMDSRIGPMLPPEAREMLRKEIRDVCDELGGEKAK